VNSVILLQVVVVVVVIVVLVVVVVSVKVKVKQPCTGPEDSRRLMLADFMIIFAGRW